MIVKLLDTTLRDGGYLNNWNFGDVAIPEIEKALRLSGIDIVESGFLTSVHVHTSKNTLYNSTDEINGKTLMINLGEYDLSLLNSCCNYRISFKKHELPLLKEKLVVLSDKKIKFIKN